MQEDIYRHILEENEKRWRRLDAEYDPVTGDGLADLLGEKRVTLTIEDFPVREQQVPKEMMSVPLIRQIAKAGSIKAFIESREWESTPSFEYVVKQIRRIRHKYDFCYWAYFCIRIKAKKGGRIRFKLNYPQLIVLARCEALRKAGLPIDIIILKARQWGGSTFCFFYQIWILFKWDQYHSFAIAAHIQTASETILQMLKKAIETYPAWDLGLSEGSILKLSQVGSTGHTYGIKDASDRLVLEGMIFIGTAEKPDTLRSKDIAGAHYSEVGIWPDTPNKRAEDLIADIQEGIVDGHLSMQVMESTAKSADDFFHDTWISAEGSDGDGGYTPVFIPWFDISHDTRPIQDKEEFARWLYDHKDENTANGKWRDNGRYYWWLWELGATLEGINWYRYRRLKSSFSKMCNEAPSTPQQAFVTAGRLVFDPFDVERMRKQCRNPVFEGELISSAHTGKDVLSDIQFYQSLDGKLKIYEMPDDSPISNRYVVAVDIGGANDTSDYSSVRVLDRLMLMEDFGIGAGVPNIVAEMHYHTDHDKLAYDAVRLASWYNNALLIIESNTLETRDRERVTGGDGFEYILDIISDIYPNLYARKNKEEDMGDRTQRKWGFHTNVYTKPKIIDNMRTCLRDSLWSEPSKVCCNEMSSYIDDNGRFTAPARKHDDVLMATAILLWVAYKEMPLPRWIKEEHHKTGMAVRDNSNITTF